MGVYSVCDSEIFCTPNSRNSTNSPVEYITEVELMPRFLYKRLKPSLQHLKGRDTRETGRTISLVGKYAKTSTLSVAHHLVILSGSLKEKKKQEETKHTDI